MLDIKRIFDFDRASGTAGRAQRVPRGGVFGLRKSEGCDASGLLRNEGPCLTVRHKYSGRCADDQRDHSETPKDA